MKKLTLSHVDRAGNPSMVDVSDKKITKRMARARATVFLGKKVMEEVKNNELTTKKGPVFQTAIIAGVMGAKRTAELIPFCHPLALEDCQIDYEVDDKRVILTSTATITGKTGVEMEALTAVTIAALTVYDMCKALSHEITIEEVRLMEKTGGKKDFLRE
ncbi:cyclic pyranopterin monophosphate synthase MoaC [soil metagenome]